MGKDRERSKPKGAWRHVDGGSAFIIPYTLLRHANWIRLGPHSCKLLLDLGRQYSGFNNGYLCAAWELMRKQGWKSRETLAMAVAECDHYRLIERTRQGGRNRPTLYALTWWPIHAKDNDPLDVRPTLQAANSWKDELPLFAVPNWLLEKRERDRRKREAAKVDLDRPIRLAKVVTRSAANAD